MSGSHNYGVSAEGVPLSRQEMRFELRCIQERIHRQKVWLYDAHRGWIQFSCHQPTNFESLEGLRIEDANACCNRTAPIFALRDISNTGPIDGFNELYRRVPFMSCFMTRMHNYIYGRWFHPYKSEIDHGQFLTKMNLPPTSELPQGTCSREFVNHVRRLSENLISRVEYTRQTQRSSEEEEADESLYSVQPSFKAVAVSIRQDNFDFETTIDMADLSVVIVRTGIEEGLSAPITFDNIPLGKRIGKCEDHDGQIIAVETYLGTAITFLLELEQRELQAFGPKPDPKKTTKNMHKGGLVESIGWHARRIGWNKATMGPLNGPSSTWVDTSKHKTWEGDGFSYDKYLHKLEKSEFAVASDHQEKIKKSRTEFVEQANKENITRRVAQIQTQTLATVQAKKQKQKRGYRFPDN